MKIKKLTAKNFRLFSDLEINFPDENFICLIGNNGSGKSAVLDAVNMVVRNFLVISFIERYQQNWAGDVMMRDPVVMEKEKIAADYLSKWEDEDNIRINELGYSLNIKLVSEGNEYDAWLTQHRKPNLNVDLVNFRDDYTTFRNINPPPIWLYFDVKRLYGASEDFFDPIKSNKTSKRKTIKYKAYKHLFTLKTDSNVSIQKFEDWFVSHTHRENEGKVKEDNLSLELDDLKPVRLALLSFFRNLHSDNYKSLSVFTEEKVDGTSWEKLKSYVTLIKENKSEKDFELKLSQLSSGEKMVTFIVAEIARKLTIANENKSEALNGKGVVLIDELDLHLHPNWQRNIVGALKATFPNVQFIVTTHSPQVLSSLKASEIIEIDGDKVFSPSVNPYGRDTNNILSTVMNDGARSKDREALINSIFINFAEDKNEKAIEQFERLKPMLSEDDPIIGRIESIIKRKEILNS